MIYSIEAEWYAWPTFMLLNFPSSKSVSTCQLPVNYNLSSILTPKLIAGVVGGVLDGLHQSCAKADLTIFTGMS